MASNHEDLTFRLDRLEHDLQELATSMTPPPATAPRDLAEQISFRAWMRISGPTLAVMVFGFTLLWNAQQVANAQMLEMSRSLGRLEGAIDRLESRMDAFDARLVQFDRRLGQFDQRLEGFDARLEALDDRMDAFDVRLESLDVRLASLETTIGKLDASVDKLAERL